MKKKLENIVQDIYKAIKPLSKGDGLDISEEDIHQFGEDTVSYTHLTLPTILRV